MDLRAGNEKTETYVVSKDTIRVFEFQSINYQKFYGVLSKVFGQSEYQRIGNGTLQENWYKRGLFINVSYFDNISGIVDILVTIAQEKSWNDFGVVLEGYLETK